MKISAGAKGIWAAAALLFVAVMACGWAQETRAADWKAATDAELRSVIPARAPVVQERIETEMRSASGITNGHGQYVAGVVLITAGYSAEGKYSHFLLTQVPLRVGNDIRLAPGDYLLGYTHGENGLVVHLYEAATGKLVGTVLAALIPDITRVEEIRIWPPGDRRVIQIGRFGFSYQIGG
ncbi:MAG TPA: hypothetical protein VFE06_14745 [Acidobacteriaceae bacterium]|jgi:hypothetical protein|nr:hypothetical protein [Acidobacteriaceae bacterium]